MVAASVRGNGWAGDLALSFPPTCNSPDLELSDAPEKGGGKLDGDVCPAFNVKGGTLDGAPCPSVALIALGLPSSGISVTLLSIVPNGNGDGAGSLFTAAGI